MAVRTDIDKKEVAERQLETAIWLLFGRGDEISVHVLACSAYQVLQDVRKKQGKSSFFEESILEIVFPERRNYFRKLMKTPYNYFKHADQDHDKSLEYFNYESNDSRLFLCAMEYSSCYGCSPIYLQTFWGWYVSCHPSIVKKEHPQSHIISMPETNPLLEKSRPEQLDFGLNMLIVQYLKVGHKIPSPFDELKSEESWSDYLDSGSLY